MDNPESTAEQYIRRRAYELWQKAGEPFGQDEHFWRLASNSILAEQAPTTTLRDKLKEYSNEAIRGLKVFDARLGYELYHVEQRVHLGARGYRPSVLWYYTNGTTLAKMLKSGEIWSTQVSCLNDSQEIRHGLDLMRDVLKHLPTGGDRHDAFKAFLMDRLTKLPRSYMNCFVLCLSEKKNDLSQWRGYSGGENGVSVGLDSDALLSKIATSRMPRLVKVEYDEMENRRKARQLLEMLFFMHSFNKEPEEISHSYYYSSDV